MGFWKWLGTAEGRSVRYPMIAVAMTALAAFVLYLLPKGEGAGRPFDEEWVIVRSCGGPMLKRDPQGRYWKVDGIFHDEVDKDAIDLVCPIPKHG